MDDDVGGIIYGLEFQARALTAQTAETDAVSFLVGTQSLKCDNQVHRIEFDEENNVITNKSIFLHLSGEVWHLSSSPVNAGIIATCYNSVSDGKCDMKSTIWRLPSDYSSSVILAEEVSSLPPSLELLTHLHSLQTSSDVKCVKWQPCDGQRVFSLNDNNILLWDLYNSGISAKLVSSWNVEGKSHAKLTTGTWNPHQNSSQIATANDTFIRIWDLRNEQQVLAIEGAHSTLVRDVDFNPNKQYYLASCGDDCKVKFWDIRTCKKPLKVLDDHSHWVWRVTYNHFHDQLLLTSSSDSRVILNSVTSLSSEPFGYLHGEDTNSEDIEDVHTEMSLTSNQDCIISTYEEHEDSVYAVEWSSADPWLFASLSYDGRFIISRIPKAIKYEILL